MYAYGLDFRSKLKTKVATRPVMTGIVAVDILKKKSSLFYGFFAFAKIFFIEAS